MALGFPVSGRLSWPAGPEFRRGAGVLATVPQQQQDRLAERFHHLRLGEPLTVALREFRRECDELFSIVHDAEGEDGNCFHVGNVHLPATYRKIGFGRAETSEIPFGIQ